MKKLTTILTAISLSVAATAQEEAPKPKAPTLKFSTTQKLDDKLAQIVGMTSAIEIDWKNKITLPNHPDSKTESLYIQKLQTKITPDRVKRIKEQADIDYTYFHKMEKKPKTKLLFDLLQNELVAVVLAQKVKFDRVRPSFVNPNIKLVIDNPRHPAYPSGHATQSHLFAYAIASLDTENGKKHLATAKDITVNREYAGVHYRSDSYVGKLLSKAMIRELVKNEKFLALYLAAGEEWGTKETAMKSLKIFTALGSSK